MKKTKTYIIAEIGSTHDGSFGLAKQCIRAAADCGVDAVKFQIHIFDAESLPNVPNPPWFKDETRKDYFNRIAFTVEQWKKLIKFSEECGVNFFASAFSLEAVDLLEKLGVKMHKIASGEVTNLPLLEKVAKTNKKVLLSSGMSSWEELDEAVNTLKNNGCSDLVVFQCTTEYPCPPEKAGLELIPSFKKRYGVSVGFSDHTSGIAIPIAAVVAGAEMIEKHFSLSTRPSPRAPPSPASPPRPGPPRARPG